MRKQSARLAALSFLLLCLWPAGCFAETYLSKESALELVLGKQVLPVYDPKPISPELSKELSVLGLLSEERTTAHFFVGRDSAGEVIGYALIDNEVGKHLPITYIVGISPQGEVTRVEMMVFREVRGWEARERRFMRQFERKALGDDLSVGSALQNVSGATLSSEAISRGVRRALHLWQGFYRPFAETVRADRPQ